MECVICHRNLKDCDTVTVGKKGLKTLIKFSVSRNDGLCNVFAGVQEICLHTNCRKKYSKENTKGVYKALQFRDTNTDFDAAGPSRSSDTDFPFQEKCFFCAKDVSDDFIDKENRKPIQRRCLTYKLSSDKTKESIVNALRVNRQPNTNQVILQRIENVNLVHAQARYHKECYSSVLLPKRNLKRGRPECSDVTSAMQIIYDFIEENEDSQFSIKELRDLLTDYIPDNRTIIKKLFDKFHGRILLTNISGRSPVVTLKDSADNILIDSWYYKKNDSEHGERLRVVKKAAEIIREDIRTKTYDKESYPALSNFLKDANEDVPESLNIFLKTLVGSRSESELVKRKNLSIAHAIISILRPKNFLSCILLALSVTLKKKFGSKILINTLNRLGFCSSYTETNVFEVSAVNFDDSVHVQSEFVQFVFDNADANINTIDGHNTFHAMGGIECRTPMPRTSYEQKILRIEKIPDAELVGSFGYVALLHYNKEKNGLKEIEVKNVVSDCEKILPSLTDLLWLYGKHKNILDIGGWNGFMQTLNEKEPFEVTHIKTLPFVNSPPSNYDTLNTVLTMACQKTAQNDQEITFVTFDQPLYAKSREIVVAATETQTPLFKTIVVRIGGFHLLMSFMGGIGYIMGGSGLKDLWSTIYAPNSITHMLTGHAYSRALRANLITYFVLAGLILNEMSLEEDESSEIENILYCINGGVGQNDFMQDVVDVFKQKFEDSLCKIERRSPTAKLWVQYFKMVCLIKKFIEAERSGNWELHLRTVKQMLPIFVASGHFNYAKSLRMYIQDMDNLEEMMPPEEYKKFTAGGFTIRRTENFWSGTWTDMVIEQSLMRTMKCRGGLTHGRSMTDSVMAKWILSMPIVQKVEDCLESFCDLDNDIDNCHKDSTAARVKRDNSDAITLTDWFEEHPPFKGNSENNIVSLSTGLVGDTKNVNCHQAFEVGQNILSKKVGMPFSDLTYSRKERVIPLSSINAACKNQDQNDTPINPLTIFQRISFLKKGEEEMKEYLTHELAPHPLALFDDSGMRKTKKSALYELFEPLDISVTDKQAHYVIDGGHLLHRVIWHKGQTYEDICITITEYIKRNYGKEVTVIFDGYEENTLLTCTKTAERIRRSGHKTTADVIFGPIMQMTTSQAEFLSSNNNKLRFILLLSKNLQQSGVNVKQCEADADTQIVIEALTLSSSNEYVIIIGDDIDFLILLTALATEDNNNVFIFKPAKGKIEPKTYKASCLKFNNLRNHMLLLHAFSGCDTTSALYNFGKKKFFDVLAKNEKLKNVLLTFNEKDPSRDAIILAGEQFFLALYGGELGGDLNKLRYQKFARSLTKSKMNLSSLPPTKSAAKQHSLRVYHQVQLWLGNPLNPVEYGWTVQNNILTPVTSTMKPAPENVLKMLFCRCKTNCGSQCGCRKSGLNCSEVCENCKGQSCTNAQIILTEPDEDDEILENPALDISLDIVQSKRLRI